MADCRAKNAAPPTIITWFDPNFMVCMEFIDEHHPLQFLWSAKY